MKWSCRPSSGLSDPSAPTEVTAAAAVSHQNPEEPLVAPAALAWINLFVMIIYNMDLLICAKVRQWIKFQARKVSQLTSLLCGALCLIVFFSDVKTRARLKLKERTMTSEASVLQNVEHWPTLQTGLSTGHFSWTISLSLSLSVCKGHFGNRGKLKRAADMTDDHVTDHEKMVPRI